MYETLAKGYVIIRVTKGDRVALIKTRVCETVEQSNVVANVTINRLKQKLSLPPRPLKDLIESLGIPCNGEIVVDEYEFKNFKKEFDAKFTDEENREAFDTVQNTLLNRKWLRDNHKTLETTKQTKKFHKLANTYRLDGNLEEWDFMREAYEGAIR
jgi:hypothetical protein